MTRSRALVAVSVLALAAAALAIRLPRLGARPMHGDEANQAVKTGILWDSGVYKYDPDQHHGPSLYWLTLPALWLCGAEDFAHSSEFMFRIVPVALGAGLIVLLLLVADGLGRGPVIIAGILTAISPAMVFYSRYYVQEMLLVFLTLAAIGCAWRYVRSRSAGWAIAAGASFGLMHATKETWVLAAAAMAAALALSFAWTRLGRKDEGLGMKDEARQSRSSSSSLILHPLSFLLAACLVAIALYSSFGAHWKGPLDSLLAFDTYLRRGTEAGIHAHPWYQYFEWLAAYRPAKGFFWTEGLIVGLACVGFIVAVLRRGAAQPPSAVQCYGAQSPSTVLNTGTAGGGCATGREGTAEGGCATGFCRFLAFYTLVLTALYCAVPYKTPWCLLSFLDGMILLAGVGAWAILRWLPGLPLKVLGGAILAAGAAHLGWESYRLNFDPRLYADYRNPYVYAHTSTDVLNLADRMERLAELSPDGHDMAIHVVTPENSWPLPWYLRKFSRVGYWPDAAQWASQTRPLPPPSVIILTPDVAEAVDARLRGDYNRQMMYGLRPEVFLHVYAREDLWQAFLASVAPPR